MINYLSEIFGYFLSHSHGDGFWGSGLPCTFPLYITSKGNYLKIYSCPMVMLSKSPLVFWTCVVYGRTWIVGHPVYINKKSLSLLKTISFNITTTLNVTWNSYIGISYHQIFHWENTLSSTIVRWNLTF